MHECQFFPLFFYNILFCCQMHINLEHLKIRPQGDGNMGTIICRKNKTGNIENRGRRTEINIYGYIRNKEQKRQQVEEISVWCQKVHTYIHCKKSFAKFRCGQRWREPNDVGVGKFLFPRRLVLRHRCQHRNLAHSDMAFFTVYYYGFGPVGKMLSPIYCT